MADAKNVQPTSALPAAVRHWLAWDTGERSGRVGTGDVPKFGSPGSSKYERLWLPVVVAVVGLVYLQGIGSTPFWRDEVASIDLATRSIPDLLQLLGNSDSPHGFYYLLLHFWSLPSTSEVWVRLLSWLFAVVAVGLAAELARRRLGLVSATAVVCLLLGNPFFAYYAREARGYTLATAFVCGAALTLLGTETRIRTRRWVVFTLLAIGAVYAHVFALVAVGALLVGHVLGAQHRPRVRELAAVVVVLLVAVSPLLWLLQRQTYFVSYITPPAASEPAAAAVRLIGSVPTAASVYLLMVVAAVGLFTTIRRRQAIGGGVEPGPRSTLSLLVAAAVVAVATPTILIAVSWVAFPVYQPRYALVATPLAAIAVAALMRLSPRHVLFSTLIAVLGLVGLPQVLAGSQDRTENLEAAATYVLSASRPGDCVAYSPAWSRPGLNYHLQRLDPGGARLPADAAVAAGGASAVAVADLYPREGTLPAVTAALQSCPRIWVAGYGGRTRWIPVPEVGSHALDALRPSRSVSSRLIFGSFQVELWVRS